MRMRTSVNVCCWLFVQLLRELTHDTPPLTTGSTRSQDNCSLHLTWLQSVKIPWFTFMGYNSLASWPSLGYDAQTCIIKVTFFTQTRTLLTGLFPNREDDHCFSVHQTPSCTEDHQQCIVRRDAMKCYCLCSNIWVILQILVYNVSSVSVDQDVRLTLNIDNLLMNKVFVLKQSSLWFYDTWM